MTTDDNDYDAFAAAYAADNQSNAWNAHYERPAMLRVAEPLTGRRVLDAGCGAGALAAALLDRGATVAGVDSSRAMLKLAAARLAGRADLHQADVRDPLPFPDEAFDIVVASLVMHYLRDWEPTLRELHRVLGPDGRLVISTHHPFMDHALAGGSDYFATHAFTETWQRGDQLVQMRFWHRPLGAITGAINAAGFALRSVEEPQPERLVRDFDPHAWASLTTQPRYLFFCAVRPGSGGMNRAVPGRADLQAQDEEQEVFPH
jgi:SAM-dependent methyltransferase